MQRFIFMGFTLQSTGMSLPSREPKDIDFVVKFRLPSKDRDSTQLKSGQITADKRRERQAQKDETGTVASEEGSRCPLEGP